MKKVFILERFTTQAQVLLNAEENLDVESKKLENFTDNDFAEANALIIRSQTKIHKKLLGKMPKLELIVTATSGFDHIDQHETKNRNITVHYCPEGNVQSAAEHTWALLLASLRNIHLAHQSIKEKKWDRSSLMGGELSGKTMGIVGLGRVGSRVAHFAKAFGMRLIYNDPYIEPHPEFEALSLIEVFRSSDVISFHTSLTDETKHLFNHQSMEHLMLQPIIINCARGEIILEDALIQALNEDIISHTALDVFEKEPLQQDSRLRKHPRVLMTPHIGATTREALEKVSLEAVEKTITFFRNAQS